MGWFGKLKNFARSLLGDRVSVLVSEALPIVELVAKLTPTRVDDEIVELFRFLKLPNEDAWLKTPVNDRGLVLLKAASDVMQKKLPHIPYTVIVSAVQLAVARFKKL